jgi:hypothetical protein
MSDNVAYVITMFIFFGWIPILAIGKVIYEIANIICLYKYLSKEEDDEEE